MEQLKGIYILKNNNDVVYNSEVLINLKRNFNYNLFFDILESFDLLADEMDSKVKQITIDDSKYFFSKDPLKKTKFIIKTIQDFSDDKANAILKDIENLYINKFLGKSHKSKYNKAKILESFNKEIRNILSEYVIDPVDFLEKL